MKPLAKAALLLVAIILLAAPGAAQVETKILIPAGTPEDQALAAISNENDAQKRTTMLEEFVQKFSSNSAAVAYGNWQLAQQLMAEGKLQDALERGDKALAAFPNGIEIMLLQVDIAQQLKNYPKVVDYAARAAGVMNAIATQPKPAGMSDQEFATYLSDAQTPFKAGLEYMETAAYNSIASEDNARKRIQEIEKFIPAFPNSKFMERVTTLAIVTLGELKDTAGLAAFGDKVLAKHPDDIFLLTVLAGAYADDPSGAYLDKARSFAKHAIEMGAKQGASADPKLAGLAHSVLGYVLLRQNQFPAAATELKTAIAMLQDSPTDLAAALYRLGFAYAKMEKAADATKALTDCAAIEGPYQPLAKDLLEKIKAARTKAR